LVRKKWRIYPNFDISEPKCNSYNKRFLMTHVLLEPKFLAGSTVLIKASLWGTNITLLYKASHLHKNWCHQVSKSEESIKF
jgi:hypothetical protein